MVVTVHAAVRVVRDGEAAVLGLADVVVQGFNSSIPGLYKFSSMLENVKMFENVRKC